MPVSDLNMAYKLKYDSDVDVLLVLLKEKGKLSHAEEIGDVVMHMDSKGKASFLRGPQRQQGRSNDGPGDSQGRSTSRNLLNIAPRAHIRTRDRDFLSLLEEPLRNVGS